MAQLGQAQVGTLKSSPKVCTIKGDDNLKVIYKNMGNGHAVPVLWCESVTVSGTEATVASGIKMHGLELASYASVQATATNSAISTATHYIEKDTVNNIIKIKTSASVTNATFDVMIMLGSANPSFTTSFRDMDSPVNTNVPDGAA